MVPVRFELQGRAAGMYRVHKGERVIRYNPYIFSKYFDDSLANTVPHEVAHYITDVLLRAGECAATRPGMAADYAHAGGRAVSHLPL